MELVLFSAIFALISISFISVLVAVVRVQSRQGASADVNQQSDFALATIQRLVEGSSYIEGAAGTASSGVMLRMPDAAQDPTLVYAAGGTLWVKQGSEAADQLLSPSVSVSGATFVKRSNAGGKDALGVSLTLNNASASSTRNLARIINVFVSRVSAATFDADIIPNASSAYKLGTSGALWQAINDVLYFGSGNVGVGAASPASKLEVNGGVRLNAGASKPTCASTIRGTLWFTQAGTGASDVIEVCARNASSTYVWVAL